MLTLKSLSRPSLMWSVVATPTHKNVYCTKVDVFASCLLLCSLCLPSPRYQPGSLSLSMTAAEDRGQSALLTPSLHSVPASTVQQQQQGGVACGQVPVTISTEQRRAEQPAPASAAASALRRTS